MIQKFKIKISDKTHHVGVHILGLVGAVLFILSLILSSVAIVKPGWIHTKQGEFEITSGFFETCFSESGVYRCIGFGDSDLDFGDHFERGSGTCIQLKTAKFIQYVTIVFICLVSILSIFVGCLPPIPRTSTARIGIGLGLIARKWKFSASSFSPPSSRY